MRILYTIRTGERQEHEGRFEIDLTGVTEASIDLVLPSWVPGSYHIIDYVRTFRGMVARAGSDGPPLAVERIDKARWRVRTEGQPNVHLEYGVYGHQMVTEAFDLSPEHLFVNAALCLPYVDGHLTEPVEVALDVPAEWRVYTELEPVGDRPPRFRAPNYDTLVDEPIDAGRPVVLAIRPAGIPHRIVLCGEGGNYDARRITEDLSKIVEATVALVGESPLRSYTFFYHLTETPDGGLEHANSNSCVIRRTVFEPKEDYQRFLSLTSHEYFHLYNVKRIRPKVLGPFDYTRENYTRLLWWMEGGTDYFADLILRRAGLFSVKKYLELVAKDAKTFLETPGRRRLSLEDASFLSWVDLYQPYEETPNRSISYYLKGTLVSMCLDLEIRQATETRASLETVLRTLWQEYGKPGRGLDEEELCTIASRSAGVDLRDFFHRYVEGTDEVDLAAFARYAGLSFGPKPREEDAAVPGYLGLRVENNAGWVRVRTVLAETPGRRAGMTAGDELVAINGGKVTYENFEKSLKLYPPGTAVDIALFRRGYLRHVSLTMGDPPPEAYVFTPVDAPTDRERMVHENWLGAKWTPPAKGGET